jgi:hypothetical protein
MSDRERDHEMRQRAREVLGELVPGLVRGNGNGADSTRASAIDQQGDPVPQVPAAPIAAVHRPSTWNRPAAPGEVIGQPALGGPDRSRANAQPTPAPAPARTQPQAAAPAAAARPPAADTGIANHAADGRVEMITIDTDEDLMEFARRLIARVANPRDRLAIHTGKLRFTLRRRPVTPGSASTSQPPGPVTRIEKGAVTERVIRDAADAGTHLVLAPGAVLTPLARERARALGVDIERERRC